MLDKTKLFEHRLMTDNEKKAQKKRLRSANISRGELSIKVWRSLHMSKADKRLAENILKKQQQVQESDVNFEFANLDLAST